MAKSEKAKLKIKYVRSVIGRPGPQKRIIEGLGFRKLNQVVERQDTPDVRGMIAKVTHLVEIVEGESS
jgi:large subunit ribosomal protein L30